MQLHFIDDEQSKWRETRNYDYVRTIPWLTKILVLLIPNLIVIITTDVINPFYFYRVESILINLCKPQVYAYTSLHYYCFLAVPYGLWDISFLTTDWTQATAVKAQKALGHQRTPSLHYWKQEYITHITAWCGWLWEFWVSLFVHLS